MDDDTRLAFHESAHTVAATVMGWPLKGVSLTGGAWSAGCSRSAPPLISPADSAAIDFGAPFSSWPEPVRELIEGRYVISASGDLGDLMLAPRPGERPGEQFQRDDHAGHAEDPGEARHQAAETAVTELAAQQVPVIDAADLADLQVLMDTPGDSDLDAIARATWFAHLSGGRDNYDAAWEWSAEMEARATDLILAESDKIIHLAHVLGELRAISGEIAAKVIRETRQGGGSW